MQIQCPTLILKCVTACRSCRQHLGLLSSLIALPVALMLIADDLPAQEPPLRLTEPLDSVVADLERVIPERMRAEDIPGLSIALIREGEMAWTKGFGVANTITARPVTWETLFEVASNSKVVTAYTALRLVDQGLLALDKPLNAYLPEPWLPPSEYHDVITLRHVLSHSSGLGHSPTSRENLFVPGRGYSYSALGFLYLQTVIEQVTGQSLEDVAQELVFQPLGMASSSFVNRASLIPRMANGHLRALLPVVLFVVPHVVLLLVIGIIGLFVLRLRTGQWRPTCQMVMGFIALTFILTLLPTFILLGKLGLAELAWIIAICGVISLVAYVLLLFVGRIILRQSFSKQPGLRKTLTVLWSLLILVGIALLLSRIRNVPVPRWTAVPVGAASSVRSTAADMAAFLIELSSPQYLSPEIA